VPRADLAAWVDVIATYRARNCGARPRRRHSVSAGSSPLLRWPPAAPAGVSQGAEAGASTYSETRTPAPGGRHSNVLSSPTTIATSANLAGGPRRGTLQRIGGGRFGHLTEVTAQVGELLRARRQSPRLDGCPARPKRHRPSLRPKQKAAREAGGLSRLRAVALTSPRLRCLSGLSPRLRCSGSCRS
jgi:hypothetical protein